MIIHKLIDYCYSNGIDGMSVKGFLNCYELYCDLFSIESDFTDDALLGLVCNEFDLIIVDGYFKEVD